jgi:hypothetical protein
MGRERIEKYIPMEDRKILTNAIKIENREKRKRNRKRMEHRKSMGKCK